MATSQQPTKTEHSKAHWEAVSKQRLVELAALPKRARFMIELVDSFVGSEEMKSKTKNMLGRVDLMQSLREASEQDESLGILSPLARPTSTTSGMTEKNPHLSFHEVKETPWGNIFTPKKKIGFFACLLELGAEQLVSKEPWPHDQEKAHALQREYYSDILQARGCECCCLNNCPVPSGLSVIAVKLKLKDFEHGISVICQAHLDSLLNAKELKLPKYAHVFIF
jgi:hypothetical protein